MSPNVTSELLWTLLVRHYSESPLQAHFRINLVIVKHDRTLGLVIRNSYIPRGGTGISKTYILFCLVLQNINQITDALFWEKGRAINTTTTYETNTWTPATFPNKQLGCMDCMDTGGGTLEGQGSRKCIQLTGTFFL